MSRQVTKATLGAEFSEGARLLWKALAAEGLSQSQGAREVKADTGLFSRWLYGERKPGRTWANAVAERFHVAPNAWDVAPTEPFAPPGAATDPNAVADARAA